MEEEAAAEAEEQAAAAAGAGAAGEGVFGGRMTASVARLMQVRRWPAWKCRPSSIQTRQ